MALPVEGINEVQGEGWKALVYPDRIVLAADPYDEGLTRAVRELLTPEIRRFWEIDFQFVDRMDWDVYHLAKIV